MRYRRFGRRGGSFRWRRHFGSNIFRRIPKRPTSIYIRRRKLGAY